MTDRRFLSAERASEGEAMGLRESAFLRAAPEGARDRQLLVGDRFDVLEREGAYAFGVSAKDGYAGYVLLGSLANDVTPTHWVSVLLTHVWPSPSIKAEPVLFLPMTARVRVLGEADGWFEVEVPGGSGFVPVGHLRALGDWGDSVVASARAFMGTPYVWAGNEPSGIDCSGLVQVAFHSCGFSCPPDSDVQAAMGGRALGAEEVLQAGDLVFWKVHVAISTGESTLVHANAHHMAVVEEPVEEAVSRIAASDTGPVTLRLRPDWVALRG
ncbi:MAG: C40 family peptidase [Boseongicola sp.]|nr:C40 family peptidase [Boseongicola sp.]